MTSLHSSYHVDIILPAVIRVIASCALVLIWLSQFFLQPLRQDAIIMHEQQLDPTEIVLIPYPGPRLCIFVLANVVATILIQPSVRCMVQTVLDIVQLSFVMMILFVVCGASPYHNLCHTYLASVYFVTSAFFQYPSILVDTVGTTTTGSTMDGESKNDGSGTSEKDPLTKIHYHNSSPVKQHSELRIPLLLDIIQQQLRGQSGGIVAHATKSSSPQYQQGIIVLHQSIVYCCTTVTVLFQILLLYDRGYQIQRYPIPIVLGCTIGWIMGTCIGAIRAIRRHVKE